jgi:CheY-like chemotaxis protein
LLVDDYVDALGAWEVFLRAEGFDVVTACNASDALAAVEASAPALIVLDLVLPDRTGCDIARALRASIETQHIPLIAATGVCDPARLAEARQAGFDAILTKPCDPTVLIATIRELLGARSPA